MIHLRILLVLLSTLFVPNKEEPSIVPTRQSITFILGQDNGKNQYYTQATHFYKNNNDFSSDVVVENVKTYKGIFDYLDTHRSALPWGEINLVVHANPWTGMSVPLGEDGKRVNSDVLLESIMEDKLKPLEKSIVDKKTQIFVHGCALGLNDEIADLVAISFGGLEKLDRPEVHISDKFIGYYSQYFDEIYYTEKYEATPYFTFYKKGYKWGDIRLSRKLNKAYPDAKIDWRKALTRKNPRWKGDSYFMTFNIPIDWVVTFESEEDLPQLKSSAEKLNWLKEQEDLMAELNELGLSFDEFLWDAKMIDYKYQDGTVEPAIKVKGWTTVLCVLD